MKRAIILLIAILHLLGGSTQLEPVYPNEVIATKVDGNTIIVTVRNKETGREFPLILYNSP